MISRLSEKTVLYLFGCFLCVVLSFALGAFSPSSLTSMGDLRTRFYCARALFHSHDPYQSAAVLQEFFAEKTDPMRTDPAGMQHSCMETYPPSTLALLAPFALLPWAVAQPLLTVLSLGSLVLAGFLILKTALGDPGISAILCSWVIANCVFVLALGNPAALAVATAVIAVWCLIEERFAALGVVLLAVSLAIKPQDAGVPWLFLLVAGGALLRRRTLQSLGVLLLLAVPSALWMSHISPHWPSEIASNLAHYSQPGAINDVGPNSPVSRELCPKINLQTDLAILWDNSVFYNAVTYVTVGALFLALVLLARKIANIRLRLWIGLACAIPLEMLVSYHRTFDAKLLLLSIPACAHLWQRGGARRWLAAGLTGLALFVTADIPLAVQNLLIVPLIDVRGNWPQRIGGILAGRPFPIVLLALAVFYIAVLAQEAKAEEERDMAPEAIAQLAT